MEEIEEAEKKFIANRDRCEFTLRLDPRISRVEWYSYDGDHLNVFWRPGTRLKLHCSTVGQVIDTEMREVLALLKDLDWCFCERCRTTLADNAMNGVVPNPQYLQAWVKAHSEFLARKPKVAWSLKPKAT